MAGHYIFSKSICRFLYNKQAKPCSVALVGVDKCLKILPKYSSYSRKSHILLHSSPPHILSLSKYEEKMFTRNFLMWTEFKDSIYEMDLAISLEPWTLLEHTIVSDALTFSRILDFLVNFCITRNSSIHLQCAK